MKGYLLRALALGMALASALAFAQPLTRLAPADAVLALSFGGGFEVAENLLDELSTLDWARAGETLNRLSVSLGEGGDGLDMTAEGLAEFCPALMSRELTLFGDETLLTVSVSPFNPLPAVSAITRFGEAERAGELEELILSCVPGEVLTLEEGGVPLYVIGDGSSFPVIIASLENLFLAGSNPEVLRGMLRRAQGAEEPSLADSHLAEIVGDVGVGLALNFAGLAEALQSFAGFLMADPSAERLASRGLAFLRTLSGYAISVSATTEGLVVEALTVINPEGGDPALAELFLCEPCLLSAEIPVPEGSVGVSGRHVLFEGLVDYLQGWLDGLDLRAILREQGLDLDTMLLDWVGEEVYTVRLAPLSSDLGSLLYRPAQVLVVSARSEEAARAGIQALANRLPELLAGLDESAGSLAEPVMDDYDYQGVAINRYRFGPTFDLGVAYLSDFLLIGSPAYALEPFIDAAFDNPSGHPDYLAARAAAPERIVGFRYGDDRATVLSLADLASLLGQPLAFFLSAGLQANTSEEIEEDVVADFGYADLSGAEIVPITVPVSLSGSLADAEEGIVYYELGGLSPGETVTVMLQSGDFDTYLNLIDGASGVILAQNDDFPDTSQSQISFRVREGMSYVVEVTSFSRGATGDYTLTLTSGPHGPDEPDAIKAEPPSFADLLQLIDILPQAMFILSDRLSYSEGYSEVRPEGLYSRTVFHVAW